MYYKDIYEDIVSSNYGQLSSVFEKDHSKMLSLAKDYLHSQGYFETLKCLNN